MLEERQRAYFTFKEGGANVLVNLALRLILEVCALVAISYWGFTTGKGILIKWLMGLGFPIIIMFIWGMFGSPAAPMPLSGIYRVLLELAIFTVASLALFASGRTTLAIVFAVLVIINKLLLYIWNQ